MIREESIEFFSSILPFSMMAKQDLASLVEFTAMDFFPRGEKILKQGGPPSKYLYIIKKGGVKVYVESDQGTETIIDYRSEGEQFGILSLVGGDRSRANVVAFEDTIAYLIPRDVILAVLQKNPPVNEYFLKSFIINFIDKSHDEARQRIAGIGSGEQLLFMNPDVIATVEEIRALIHEKSEHPDAALLSPQQVGTDGRPQKVFDDFPSLLNQSKTLKALVRLIAPTRSPDPRAKHTELTWCDWVTGSFLLVDRKDYDAIDGWSPDYWMYVEDADLCRRAHEAGLRVAYTPKVQVIHAHGGSSRINVQVKSMTKLEVIISKHVDTSKHTQGFERWLTHFLIILLRVPFSVCSGAIFK